MEVQGGGRLRGGDLELGGGDATLRGTGGASEACELRLPGGAPGRESVKGGAGGEEVEVGICRVGGVWWECVGLSVKVEIGSTHLSIAVNQVCGEPKGRIGVEFTWRLPRFQPSDANVGTDRRSISDDRTIIVSCQKFRGHENVRPWVIEQRKCPLFIYSHRAGLGGARDLHLSRSFKQLRKDKREMKVLPYLAH